MSKEKLSSGYAADALKKDLIAKIKSGELLPGDKLLSERKMALAYNISYMTVRRAVEELVTQGFVTRHPKRGSFVNHKFHNVSHAENLTFAFISQCICDGVFCELLAAIERRARQNNYMMIFCNSNMDVALEKSHLEEFLHSNVSGIILFPVCSNANRQVIQKLTNSGIPVVTIDNICAGDEGDSVDCNNFDLGYRATEHLIKFGHTNIAHITVARENFRTNYVAQRRMDGFLKAMEEHDLTVPAGNIQHLSWEYTSLPISEIDLDNLGYEQAMKLLRRPDRPTAIMALFDEIAVGVYHAARELGLKIPEDLSVIGINNTDLSNRLIPGLTTMAQPFRAVGLRAVDILVLHNKFHEENCIKDELLGTLVQRGSVAQNNKKVN